MIYKIIFVSFLCIGVNIAKAQSENTLFSESYLSGELDYRSYGTGDIIGFGGGIEYSKDVKKWLGWGLNLSYWSNQKKSWDFTDPYTLYHFVYYDQISEIKLSPFVQLIPLNTKHVDFYVQAGLALAHYNQVFQLGGYITDLTYSPERIFSYVTDMGKKKVIVAYEFGVALRFQFNRVIIVPNSVYSSDFEGNDYNSLNLKIGFQLKK